MKDTLRFVMDLKRRSRSFFESERRLGPLIAHRITLRQGWVEDQPVVKRHDTRTILLEVRQTELGYESTTLEAVYIQNKYPLFEEEQVSSLRVGLWHGLTLDQLWHPEDYWYVTLVSTLWTSLSEPRVLSSDVIDGPEPMEELPEGMDAFVLGEA